MNETVQEGAGGQHDRARPPLGAAMVTHPDGTPILDQKLVDLIGIYTAIKEGAKPSDYFGTEKEDAEASANTAAKLADTAKAGAAAKPRPIRQPAQPAASGTEATAQKEVKAAEKEGKPVEEALAAAREYQANEAAPATTSAKAENTAPISCLLKPRSLEINGAACAMHTRSI